MKAIIKATFVILFTAGISLNVSAQFSQRNAKNFLNKTSYIIGEAYDIVYYYGFYSSGYLSKAVNHQNYAKYLYNIRNYRHAIYHSDLARTYALQVIYNSNNYWDNYYRPYYYYAPPRPPYVNNKHPHNNYNHNYNYNYNYSQNQNVQYGPRSGTSVSSVNRASNSRVSKYSSTGNEVKSVDFNTWNRSYYSSEETSLLRGVSVPSERELESAVANSTSIRRVSDDKSVINSGIRNFSSDIDSYKRSNAEEAKTISISRPSDFGTTPEVTRSTANTVSPINTRQQQTQPTQTREEQSQPVPTRQQQTQPTQTRQEQTQPVQTRQQQTQPTQTRQEQTQPVPTRQQQTQPQMKQEQTQPVQTRQQQTQPTQMKQEQHTQPTQTRQGTHSTAQPTTKTSSESTQPASRNTTTNQQATPQRNSTPTNQNTNSNTQRR